MQIPDATRGRGSLYIPLMFAAMLAMLALAVYAPAASAQSICGEDRTLVDGECVKTADLNENIEPYPENGGYTEEEAAEIHKRSMEESLREEGIDPDEYRDQVIQQTGGDISCEDFTTISGEPSQFQAQQYYDTVATPEEQTILDPEGNGFACDGGQITFGEDPAEAPAPVDETVAPVAEAPVAGAPVADNAAALPETGGPALLLPLAGLMAAVGLGLAFIRRR